MTPPSLTPTNGTNAPGILTPLLDSLLASEYAADPVMASRLGLTDFDALLPDLSEQAWRRRDEDSAARLVAFEAVDPEGLTDPEDRADRDLAVAILRGRAVLRDWANWRRDPELYSGVVTGGVHGLFLARLRPDGDLVEAAVARLRGAPDVLAHGRANLDPELASPLLVRRALGGARAALGYVRDEVPRQVGDEGLRARLADAGAVAAGAYAEWVTFLESLAERATGSWAVGETRYDGLLREREGLPYGARGLQERGQAAYDALAGELRELTSAVRGHEDWRAYVEELNDDAPPTPEAMREEYEDWTARARAFLVERGLVTLPAGERCDVVPAAPFVRSVIAVAHYQPPPPFATTDPVGTFFVPYPPDGASEEEVRDRLRSNARFSIPTTSVHEAYPGHHWHFAHLAATQHRPLRAVFRTPYFTEGWGLYAEQMMRDNGFFTEPAHVVGQLEARLFRAARMVVDTALHLGEMSPEEATTYMTEKTALAPETARAEVARYCAWPTQAPSYLTGALEIGRMAREWRGSPVAFHDALAGSGGLPIGVAERLLAARAGGQA